MHPGLRCTDGKLITGAEKASSPAAAAAAAVVVGVSCGSCSLLLTEPAVCADRGAGQRPVLQLSPVLHGVSGQSGFALHAVQPLGQQQSRPPQRIAAAPPLQGLGQEGAAALGPGAVPQVSRRPVQVRAAGAIDLLNRLCLHQSRLHLKCKRL